MTIVFATNDLADFPGAIEVTTAGKFRADYVSEAFIVCNGDDFTVITSSWSNFPEVSGDITWIHFQYSKFRVIVDSVSVDGETLFAAYDSSGNKMFHFDLSNGKVQMFLDGVLKSSFTDPIKLDLVSIDMKFDTTGANTVVDYYVNSALIARITAASTSGNPIALHWRSFDHVDFSSVTNEHVSEFIVADEDTRNMGLSLLTPTSAGNHTGWNGDYVELGDNDLGTGAVAGSTGLKLSSVMSAYAGPATSGLRALVVNNKGSTRGSVGDIRNFLRMSATDYNGAAMGVTETIKTYVTVFDTNPDTSDVWASSDFSGVEVGVESLA